MDKIGKLIYLGKKTIAHKSPIKHTKSIIKTIPHFL